MEEKMYPHKKTARVAGLLYFILICAALYAHVYVPSQIFVRGNPEATTNNILANEFLFRTCIVVSLIEATVFLFLVLTLYRLFKQVDKHRAGLMVALVCVQIPVAFVLGAFKLTALMILKGESSQLPDQAMLFLEMNGYGNATLALFGGLWLFPLGLLVCKSRFMPRLFGVLLIIAGTGYTIGGLIPMLFPDYSQPSILPFLFFGLGEIPIMLWLLIKGVKDHVSIEVVSETKTPVRWSAV